MHHILSPPHILFWTRHNVNKCELTRHVFLFKTIIPFCRGVLHTIPNHLYTFRGNSGLMQCMLHLCSPVIEVTKLVFWSVGWWECARCPKFIVRVATVKNVQPSAQTHQLYRLIPDVFFIFSANAVFSCSWWQEGQRVPRGRGPFSILQLKQQRAVERSAGSIRINYPANPRSGPSGWNPPVVAARLHSSPAAELSSAGARMLSGSGRWAQVPAASRPRLRSPSGVVVLHQLPARYEARPDHESRHAPRRPAGRRLPLDACEQVVFARRHCSWSSDRRHRASQRRRAEVALPFR